MDAVEELTDLKNHLTDLVYQADLRGVLDESTWNFVKCKMDLWVDTLTTEIIQLVREINTLYGEIQVWTPDERTAVLIPSRDGVWIRTG